MQIVLPVCGVGLVLLILIGTVEVIDANLERRHTEALMAAFGEVQVGVTDLTRTEVLTKQFEAHRVEPGGGNPLELTFFVNNNGLCRLHLAPCSSFYAILDFKDGIVRKKTVILVNSLGIGGTVTERRRGSGSAVGRYFEHLVSPDCIQSQL